MALNLSFNDKPSAEDITDRLGIQSPAFEQWDDIKTNAISPFATGGPSEMPRTKHIGQIEQEPNDIYDSSYQAHPNGPSCQEIVETIRSIETEHMDKEVYVLGSVSEDGTDRPTVVITGFIVSPSPHIEDQDIDQSEMTDLLEGTKLEQYMDSISLQIEAPIDTWSEYNRGGAQAFTYNGGV
jgi:hypothetical protein